MAKVNILSSAWAGFSLIARRPLSVLAWGVVYLILAMGPYALIVGSIGPDLVDYYRQVLSDPQSASRLQQPASLVALNRYQGLQLLGSLAAVAIVYTAIQRAVIFPDQKSWFSLRLSWAELRTAALTVILYIAFTLVIVVASIIIAVPVIVAVAAAGGGSDGVMRIVMTTFVVIIGVLLALAYPMGRLAMAIPMSVGEDRFRLFEAWKLTRGYGWQLVFIFLLVMLIFVFIEAVMFLVLGVAAVSTIGSLDPAAISAYFARPDWVKDAMGWLLTAGACWLVLTLISTPVMVAPWAEAYRRIAGVKTRDAHAVFE